VAGTVNAFTPGLSVIPNLQRGQGIERDLSFSQVLMLKCGDQRLVLTLVGL
jgi:hypothetical protein